ncbi:uncharacterized protein LOC141590651 [Silene latifolia]|uniref:uncharacterized protein LOC141590651 n=1 Tax=Silene latifolia TaxID=37657 RepID=UPI003D775960
MALKKKIVEDKISGEVAAFVYVVEFLKRGLPHAHLLLIMKPSSKMNCPEDFDKFVSAEIPPMTNESLRTAVLKHMMHGPCGRLDPDRQCMKHKKTEGHCKYSYPKPFASDTTNTDDRYPVYKRRDTGESAKIRGHDLNNQWVIPYNPYLLDLFDCHLNVEVCSTIQAVKYLYKYVYKGHDKISFNVAAEGEVKVVDEIEQYQSGRWVSPVAAIWRIYGFDLFEIHPPVMLLLVHLPFSDEKRIRTPLTEFFRLNSVNSEAANQNVVTNQTANHRRLVFISPSEGERYFLRLLLAHVKAPKSFEDLRTVNGQRFTTYQEDALELRLVKQDNMVDLCLNEAIAVQMSAALRHLFVTLLIFCQPKDPASLWDKYYTSLSEDYSREYPCDTYTVRVLTVRKLEQHLEAMGKSLRSFGLGHLSEPQDSVLQRTRDITDALNAPVPEECMLCRTTLNSDQQHVFDTIMEHVTANKPGAFFVDGPGGTGKTYLYNALYAEVRLLGKIILPTASSGIAAANIPSGRTTHSRFKLPLDLAISLTCNVPKQSSLAALIQAASLIIWDEASMARKETVEALDLLFRDLCDSDVILGVS